MYSHFCDIFKLLPNLAFIMMEKSIIKTFIDCYYVL